jgi:uncharacterized protein YbcV (DUF1398 family)
LNDSEELYQIVGEWQTKRQSRLLLEREFLRYTGWLDVVEAHVPYTKYDYFFDILDRRKRYKGNKIIVFAGDNLNLDVFGPFFRTPTAETSDRAASRKELDTLLHLLEKAEKIYDRIIFMQTNHDKRIYKILQRVFGDKKQVEEIMRWVKPLKEFMEERKLSKIVHTPGILFTIGDAVIYHWENNSSIPASTSRKVIKGTIARMPSKINVIYQAHTHFQSRFAAFRKLIIETGALCDIFDYARGDKLWGEEKTITIGYAYGEFKDGIADWNKCDYYTYEVEGYI